MRPLRRELTDKEGDFSEGKTNGRRTVGGLRKGVSRRGRGSAFGKEEKRPRSSLKKESCPLKESQLGGIKGRLDVGEVIALRKEKKEESIMGEGESSYRDLRKSKSVQGENWEKAHLEGGGALF